MVVMINKPEKKTLAKIIYTKNGKLLTRDLYTRKEQLDVLDNQDVDTKDLKVIMIFNNGLMSFKIKQAT